MPGNSAGETYVEVLPELKEFGSKLASEVRRGVDDAGGRVGSIGGRLKSAVGGTFSTIAKGAVIGLGSIGVAAGLMATRSIAAYTESAAVGAQTTAGIKSTGSAAGVTAKHVGNLANAIRNYSGIDDEAIQSGENLLLTFTNIRNEAGKGNDIFDQSVRSMADLSARMGGDTKSAAIQLGKALNDPVKGITALQRVGVSFTEKQKDQIKALVKSGDLMGAQKVVLGELTKEFGGSAKAMGQANPAAILQSQMGDVLETIGGAIMPIITKLLSVISPVLQQLGPIIAQFISQLGPVLTPIIQALGPVLGVVADALGQILLAIAPLLPPLAQLLIALLPLITLTAQWASFLISKLVPALNFFIGILTVVVSAVVGFIANWRAVWETVRSVALGVWDSISGAASRTWHGIVRTVTGIWRGLSNTARTIWNGLRTIIWTPIQWIQTAVTGAWNSLAGIARTAWTAVAGAIRGAINVVIGVINTFIRAYNSIPILPNIPQIPHVAMGGPAEGLVTVGEHGPENVILPAGSRVIGAAGSRGEGGGAGVNVEQFNVYGPVDAAEVIREWNWSLMVGDLGAA